MHRTTEYARNWESISQTLELGDGYVPVVKKFGQLLTLFRDYGMIPPVSTDHHT